jgi:outer membrane protein OmpA-like peptidoglycan-associated protein
MILDHFSLIDADSSPYKKYSYGLELGYHRAISNWLSFGIPLKFGIIQLQDDPARKVFSAVDFVLRAQIFNPSARLSPFVFAGGGVVNEDLKTTAIQFPIGAGLNIKVTPKEYITLSAEYRRSLAENRDNLQFGIGVLLLLGKNDTKIGDKDNDGVPDNEDLCPDKAGTFALRGCPDRDNDGIPDKDDKCPDVPGTLENKGCPDVKDTDGDGIMDDQDDCPDEPGPSLTKGCPDRDGDGVVDKYDKCPDVAGTKANDGCPASKDSDGDGVDDAVDRCPTLPGSAANQGCPDSDGDGIPDIDDDCPTLKGLKEFKGCPDSDGDGINDKIDKCPYAAGPASNQGCPLINEEVKAVLKKATQSVKFKTGTALLEVESYKTLNEVTKILNENPTYNIEISGHTDNVGKTEKNQKLSEERAKSCYDYIIAQGIDPARLTYKGYGKTLPIATNETVEGRSQNRRTEFNIFFK